MGKSIWGIKPSRELPTWLLELTVGIFSIRSRPRPLSVSRFLPIRSGPFLVCFFSIPVRYFLVCFVFLFVLSTPSFPSSSLFLFHSLPFVIQRNLIILIINRSMQEGTQCPRWVCVLFYELTTFLTFSQEARNAISVFQSAESSPIHPGWLMVRHPPPGYSIAHC